MKSRKFIMLAVCLGLAAFLPIAFQLLKIDKEITTVSLSMIGAVIGIYFGVNVLQKKIEK